MATADELKACVLELKAKLRSAGFQVGDGPDFDAATVKVFKLVGGDWLLNYVNASAFSAQAQLAACRAARAIIDGMSADALKTLAAVQRGGQVASEKTGLGVGTLVGCGALAVVGLYLVLR